MQSPNEPRDPLRNRNPLKDMIAKVHNLPLAMGDFMVLFGYLFAQRAVAATQRPNFPGIFSTLLHA